MKIKTFLSIILFLPLGAFAQKKTKGIVTFVDEIGQFSSFGGDINVYYDFDTSIYTTTNRFGEYKLNAFCDSCLLVFEAYDLCTLSDSILVKHSIQPSKKKTNFKFPLCYHFDIFTCRFLTVGYEFKSAYAPHGFTFNSNQSLFNYRRCSRINYGLSYSTDFYTNQIFSFDSKVDLKDDFYFRSVSLEADYYDIKTQKFEIINISTDFSSNFKFFYYSFGAGIYLLDYNTPFLRTGVEIPFDLFRSRFYVDTDLNNHRINYRFGINSTINRFKTKIGFQSLFDYQVFEIGLAYQLLY